MLKNYPKRPHRLIAILKELYHTPEGLSTKEISDMSGISVRMIEKDFVVLKEIYPGNIVKKNNRYIFDLQSTTQNNKQVALKIQNRMVVKLALDLLEHGADLSQYRDAVIDELELEKLMLPYYIKPEYYETLDIESTIIKKLSEYVHYNYHADILFRNKAYRVEPYKIVNFDGIWYLYAKDIEQNKLKTWAIREIQDAEKTPMQHRYSRDENSIYAELNKFHSAYFVEGKEINVLIKVDSDAAYLFKARDYVKNQKIVSENKDDCIIVSFTATSYEDIDDIVKMHLPLIEILEPTEFRDRFIDELKLYMKKINAI